MSTAATASPSRIGSLHFGKSGAITSNCKTVLTEQHQRLWSKHSADLDLIDDLRTFIKVKCHIEKDYCNAIIKLLNSHQSKKYPQFKVESESDVKSLYTVWKQYMDEMDKIAKHRLSEFEQIVTACDTLKQMKSHKAQVGKKVIDTHLKKMQEEVITSINELEKNKKAYFDEENFAKVAREKEEKLKKRKGGIFSKFTDLQSKKEKSSAQREASDIQSTQARNEYIMSLVAANAHLNHYYTVDMINLMRQLEDDVLDKCRGFMSALIQGELSSTNTAYDAMDKVNQALENTSGDVTNSAFLSDPTSACLKETLQYEFESCENDPITVISKDNNAELALQTEITKWSSCYTKECRNLNRLSQQLIKCQTMLAGGHKTVEVTGVGQVDVETRIDDIKQQLRKCEISKVKAEARLTSIRESGMAIDDLNVIESQITTEMKQSSLDVDVAPLPLSRTPSVRSNKDADGRMSSMEAKSFSDDKDDMDKAQTPEPGEVITEPEVGESPEPETYTTSYQYENYEASWNTYDPTAAWNDAEPENQQTEEVVYASQEAEITVETNEYNADYNQSMDANDLVGKTVQALYAYDAQNVDDLSFVEGETLRIIAASDRDWASAQNDRNEVGYIPVAYVQVIEEIAEAYAEEQNEVPAPVPVTEQANQGYVEQQTEEYKSTESDTDYVRAAYDYTATSEEEISFQEGDLIKILERSDDGWWLGEKDGITGHFPSMLVHELNEAEAEEAPFEGGLAPGYKVINCFETESESGESGNGSPEFALGPPPGPPPPTFAPPKPAYLTPNQVVIIQPTPEIESRGTFGEGSNDAEENETQEDVIEEDFDQEAVIAEGPSSNQTEFVLEKPSKKKAEVEIEVDEGCEDVDDDEQATPEEGFERTVDVTTAEEAEKVVEKWEKEAESSEQMKDEVNDEQMKDENIDEKTKAETIDEKKEVASEEKVHTKSDSKDVETNEDDEDIK